MAKANHANITISMLDAIAPSRQRFNVINGSKGQPNATMALIDRLAADLAAKGPVFPQAPKAIRSPYITSYGKILDPEAHAAWIMAQRKGGAL
jgi:hypothetical protein